MARTQLSRWTPAPAWLGERDPFRHLMETFFNDAGGRGEELSNRAWHPAVDIRENGDAYVVSAELPGLGKDDVAITIENNVLKLSGERRFEQEAKEEEYHRVERAYGSFTRAFSLPTRVDPERVEASFQDGILTITVPKAAEARPRKIEIA